MENKGINSLRTLSAFLLAAYVSVHVLPMQSSLRILTNIIMFPHTSYISVYITVVLKHCSYMHYANVAIFQKIVK